MPDWVGEVTRALPVACPRRSKSDSVSDPRMPISKWSIFRERVSRRWGEMPPAMEMDWFMLVAEIGSVRVRLLFR